MDGDSLREALDAARDAVEAERGVRVYGRLPGRLQLKRRESKR